MATKDLKARTLFPVGPALDPYVEVEQPAEESGRKPKAPAGPIHQMQGYQVLNTIRLFIHIYI